MRNKIFAALAAGALLLPVLAQNYKVVVTTNDDVRTEFKTESLKDIRFGEAPEYGEANELVRAIYTS